MPLAGDDVEHVGDDEVPADVAVAVAVLQGVPTLHGDTAIGQVLNDHEGHDQAKCGLLRESQIGQLWQGNKNNK